MAKEEIPAEEVKQTEKPEQQLKSRIKKERIIYGSIIGLLLIGCIVSLNVISSKNKFIKETEEKQKIIEDERVRLASIRNAIEEMIQEEAQYLQVSSSSAADLATKQNASLLYKTKSSSLIDGIKTKFTEEDLDAFDPNLLMNYARHLDMTGEPGEAKKILEYVIGKAKDSITLAYSFRSLANIHVIPSSDHFSPDLSRKYHQQDIDIAKAAPTGNERYINLINLYESWAIDEYTHLKNKENGNKLIDTAVFCINKLPDYEPVKAELAERIQSTYSFYNDILIPANTSGDYKFYINNKGVGDAFISMNSKDGSIRIDYLSEGTLVGQLTGNGGYVDHNLLKFDVQIESFSNVFNKKKNSSGTLELQTKEGKLLDGNLYEYGKKPVPVKLAKQQSN
ncbi:hypothetical protein GWK08_17670 [Leptobacterium flavescens]|uniref:Uncharacterized protein n=1 Tax=Leptobacterium flavescens TaxID=472055 RepID=A0A6P0UTX5_9FLAO|nr:hypothetical protein [Leptobacterium flavescens]NER15289.1 hypothetical protein [Leptobacterium flavescens]